MNTIPWTVSAHGGEPVVISGAKIDDSVAGQRVVRLYGVTPGQMRGDSQTAVHGSEIGSLLIHFDAGDPEESRRARRLIHQIAHGKAQNMTIAEMQSLITGKRAAESSTLSPAEFDRRMSTLDPRDSGQAQQPEKPRPLAPDDADIEKRRAAGDKLGRMEGWQAERPSVAADEAVGRARERVRAAGGGEVLGDEEQVRAGRKPVTPQPDKPTAGMDTKQPADAQKRIAQIRARLAQADDLDGPGVSGGEQLAMMKELDELTGKTAQAKEREEAAKAKAGEVRGATGDKPKVEYVRAPAGGATSEVDGRHYRGGQLMPVHGKYSGMERPPKGEGVGGSSEPAKPDEDGGGAASRRVARPLTPEQIEEKRREAEDQRKWDEMNAGPFGRMKWLGRTPNAKAAGHTVIGLKEWREYAEKVGPEGVKRLIAALEPEFHAAVDRSAPNAEAGEWYKDNARKQAAESLGFSPGGKGHEKKIPDSHYARILIQEMMGPQNTPGLSPTDRLHRLHKMLADVASAPKS
jgi:hypothetical protein